MASADSLCALTYNGEIYNYLELRGELEKSGYVFRSNSDTEVLLAGYLAWGEQVVDHLVGMFAFAIWDGSSEKLFLARDRAGEKPLFYSDSPEGFAFASELRPLASCPWVDTANNREALAQYLRYGYVPSPLTIHMGIAKLPPAHTLTVTARTTTLTRYWNPLDFATAPPMDIEAEAAIEELEARLTSAVAGQLVSDMPIGAFLSGGVDSATVVALMQSLTNAEVRTFTIGFDVAEYDESPHAATVSRHLGTKHTCRQVDMRSALDLVDKLPVMYGEPFADPSAIPMRLLASTARADVTVALTGDGADELFGGYGFYDRVGNYDRLVRLGRPISTTILPVLAGAPGQVGRRARRLRDSIQGAGTPGYRHYFTDSEIGTLLGVQEPTFSEADRVWLEARSLAPHRRAMLTDFETYMSGDVLTKVDRASMAESLETRAPFLDHRLIEWALRLPGRLLQRKYLLKRLLARRLPPEWVNRPKHGFSVPVGQWLRNELSARLRDELGSESFTGLGLNPDLIDGLVDHHLDGTADHARRLWILFMLARWQIQQDERSDNRVQRG